MRVLFGPFAPFTLLKTDVAQHPKLPILRLCFACFCNAFSAIARELLTDFAETRCCALPRFAALCRALLRFSAQECGSAMYGEIGCAVQAAAAVYVLPAHVCLEFWVEWVPSFLGLWVLWMVIRRWHRCRASCVCRGCHLRHEHVICPSWKLKRALCFC